MSRRAPTRAPPPRRPPSGWTCTHCQYRNVAAGRPRVGAATASNVEKCGMCRSGRYAHAPASWEQAKPQARLQQGACSSHAALKHGDSQPSHLHSNAKLCQSAGLDLLGELSSRRKVAEWLSRAEESGGFDDFDVSWDAPEVELEEQEGTRRGSGNEQASGADMQGNGWGVAVRPDQAELSHIPVMEFEGECPEAHVRINSKNCFADVSEAELRRAVYTASGALVLSSLPPKRHEMDWREFKVCPPKGVRRLLHAAQQARCLGEVPLTAALACEPELHPCPPPCLRFLADQVACCASVGGHSAQLLCHVPGPVLLTVDVHNRRMQWEYKQEDEEGCFFQCILPFQLITPASCFLTTRTDGEALGQGADVFLVVPVERQPHIHVAQPFPADEPEASGESDEDEPPPLPPPPEPFVGYCGGNSSVEESVGQGDRRQRKEARAGSRSLPSQHAEVVEFCNSVCEAFEAGRHRRYAVHAAHHRAARALQSTDQFVFQLSCRRALVEASPLEHMLRERGLWRDSASRPMLQLYRPKGFCEPEPKYQTLPFDVFWRLNVMLSDGVLHPSTIDWALVATLIVEMRPRRELSAEQALQRVVAAMDVLAHRSHTNRHARALSSLSFQKELTRCLKVVDAVGSARKRGDSHRHEHCMWVACAVVTPSRVYCKGPRYELANRMLRNFKQFQRYFLRVHFLDEDMQRVNANERNQLLLDRVRHVMVHGLTVYGRLYHFVAYSNSQLRQLSCWFIDAHASVAEPDQSECRLTASEICDWMGDTKHIRSPGTLAKRLGQCLSTTYTASDPLSETEYELIEDRRSLDGRFTYTDGCGLISPDFAAAVAQRLRLEHVPSAYQVRFMGCKGVLATFPMRKGLKVQIRQSMKKFDTALTGLEVCEWAKFRPAYLNRQIILLLSCNGVPDRTLIRIQTQMLHKLSLAMDSPEASMQMLKMVTGPVALTASADSTDWPRMLVHLIEAGVDVKSDPFLAATLWDIRTLQLLDLKQRARIRVPNGGVLLGVADPSETLCYGQVVVQVTVPIDRETEDSETGFEPKVITGKVAVTRNPCLHPGDIRILQAVEPHESIKHLQNVIIFPVQGNGKEDRPHPDEMAGGDLDGDEFSVYWECQLLEHLSMSPAMENGDQEALKLDREVTREDLANFFVSHLESSNLGGLSNAHLVWADKGGANSAQCIKLAKLATAAVDFAKTGIVIKMPRGLRAKSYPDFMERTGKDTYMSQGVLGKLYRDVMVQMRNLHIKENDAKYLSDPAERLTADEHGITPTTHLNESFVLSPGYEDFLGRARKLCQSWEMELRHLMLQYGIMSESQLFSGAVLKFRKDIEDDREIVVKVKEAICALKHAYRKTFSKDLEKYQLGRCPSNNKPLHYPRDVFSPHPMALCAASAWYVAAYQCVRDTPTSSRYAKGAGEGVSDDTYHGGSSGRVLSFAWVMADRLLEVKRYKELLSPDALKRLVQKEELSRDQKTFRFTPCDE